MAHEEEPQNKEEDAAGEPEAMAVAEEEEEEHYDEGPMPEVCVLVLFPRYWPVASVRHMLNPATCLPSHLRRALNHYTDFFSKSKQLGGGLGPGDRADCWERDPS